MNLEEWTNFFAAAAGAASALAGLVFVALSINLTKILQTPGLTPRSAETIILLSAGLIAPLIGLIPAQSARALGLELGAVAVVACCVPLSFQIVAGRAGYYQRRWQFVQRVMLHQLATVPLLLAGAFIFFSKDDGLYWLALGITLTLVVGLLNAWILLVEIDR